MKNVENTSLSKTIQNLNFEIEEQKINRIELNDQI